MSQIEIILLCLLCDKDYYGYEFDSVIEQRNMREWTNVGFSSIYSSLSKLEKKGLIASRYEKEYGSPKRKVYSIEDEAREIVKEQIIRLLGEYDINPSGFDIAMLFSHLITSEELRYALIIHKNNLSNRKKFLLQRYGQHPTAKVRPHIKALFERPIAFIDTEIMWIEEYLNDNFKEE